MNLDLFLKHDLCTICNNHQSHCICPKGESKLIISGVSTKMLSKKKYITVVFGRVMMKHFTMVKAALGTGGKWGPEECIFRGQNQKRVVTQLKKLSYQFP